MKPLLQITNLTKRYGRITAVDQVSFSIREGEVLGLIGPNGCQDSRASRRSGALVRNLSFCGSLLAHGTDHWRRGFKVLTPEVNWAGTVLSVLAVISITPVLTRHSWGPLVAVAVGFPMAVGVAASHLLPHWSSFSDAFPGSGVDSLSYAAVVFEVIASLVFGAAGMRIPLHPRQRRT